MRTLLKNAKIYDGTGAESFAGDILIEEDRIVRVAPKVEEDADCVMDLKGLSVSCVCFQFFDPHPKRADIYTGSSLKALKDIKTIRIYISKVQPLFFTFLIPVDFLQKSLLHRVMIPAQINIKPVASPRQSVKGCNILNGNDLIPIDLDFL